MRISQSSSAGPTPSGREREASSESIWKLTWRGCSALALAMLAGVLLAIPFIYRAVVTRFRSYSETTYLVDDSPHLEERLTRWANLRPGIEKFECRRRNGELWVRWEYRGLLIPETVRNGALHIQELGYQFRGEHGGSSGVIVRDLSGQVGDVMTDSPTLAALLLGAQAGFGLTGLWLIRAAFRRGQAVPPLFSADFGRPVLIGFTAGLALFVFGTAYSFALKLLLGTSPPSPWNALESMSFTPRMILLLFGALGAPVAEEIFFRGYLFGTFKRANHIVAGILISAALFACAHFSDLYNVPAVFVYGVVLASAYHRTQSIFSSIAAHVLNNALAIGIMVFH